MANFISHLRLNNPVGVGLSHGLYFTELKRRALQVKITHFFARDVVALLLKLAAYSRIYFRERITH